MFRRAEQLLKAFDSMMFSFCDNRQPYLQPISHIKWKV